jgi:hypothetical protein
MPLLDYDYGSALGSNRVHPRSESAIHSALVGGNSPMNSLGLRTEVMLDCLELLADSTAVEAMWDGWSYSPPPLSGRHPDEAEEEEEPEGEELDEEDDLDGDDFDDDEDDFDDDEFDEEEDEDIDEDLDDEIDDIDVDDDEEDDFDDDDDLDLDEEEDADVDDI